MEVIRSDAMGMCFGVRAALDTAAALPSPGETTILGELVHNEVVTRELEAKGFHQLPEGASRPEIATRRVLITAHGVSDRARTELAASGRELVDTTCPLVRKAHAAALALAAEGRHVIVLGKRGHVEVRGLVGDLESWTVVERPEDVARWDYPRLGIVCQTTLPDDRARVLHAAIRAANPHADIAFRDTVCEPTRARQRAVRELARRVQAMVVVGGAGSNNTRQLVQACDELGVPAFHVQGPDDVDAERLAGFAVVGLTAGTSTLDATIDAVEAALRALPAARGG